MQRGWRHNDATRALITLCIALSLFKLGDAEWRSVWSGTTRGGPPARYAHVMAGWVDAEGAPNVIVNGGAGTISPTQPWLRDTWRFNGATGVWSRIPDGPPGLKHHCGAWDPSTGTLAIFGGLLTFNTHSNQLWLLNIQSGQWSHVPAGNGSWPSERSSCGCAWRNGAFLVFGGYSGTQFLSDIWRYDPQTAVFAPIQPMTGGSPAQVAGFEYSMLLRNVTLGDQPARDVILALAVSSFAGDDVLKPGMVYAFTMVDEFGNGSWNSTQAMTSSSVTNLRYFATAPWTSHAVVFGGSVLGAVDSEVYACSSATTNTLDLEAGVEPTWYKRDAFGSQPAPPALYREMPSMVVIGNTAFVHGGVQDRVPVADMWSLDLLGGTSLPVPSVWPTCTPAIVFFLSKMARFFLTIFSVVVLCCCVASVSVTRLMRLRRYRRMAVGNPHLQFVIMGRHHVPALITAPAGLSRSAVAAIPTVTYKSRTLSGEGAGFTRDSPGAAASGSSSAGIASGSSPGAGGSAGVGGGDSSNSSPTFSCDNCVICLDDFKDGMALKRLPCGHLFHPACIGPWILDHATCPTCKFRIPAEDAYAV